MPVLSEDQKTAYQREGYLCPVRVFSPEKAAEHRAALESLESAHDGKLEKPVADYLRIAAYLATEVPMRLARDEGIIDAVEGILGPDIMMWSCEYFIKEANTHKIVSWHQDLTYWGMDGSDHEVTAWVALSPATADSGCMKFVPGSHKQQIVPHEDTFAEDNLLSRGQEIAVDVNEEDAIVAALQPGEMSLHHGRLFHASGPNTTDDRRIGLVIRYIRPDTPSTGKGKDFGVMVRGVDRHGIRANIAPRPGSFTPQQLSLYDEVLAAQAAYLADGLDDSQKLYAKKETADV